MPGQSLCKLSVSKHSRIRLSSPFPVCASVDFVHQSSVTIIVYIHIRYTLHTLKRQSQNKTDSSSRAGISQSQMQTKLIGCPTKGFINRLTLK